MTATPNGPGRQEATDSSTDGLTETSPERTDASGATAIGEQSSAATTSADATSTSDPAGVPASTDASDPLRRSRAGQAWVAIIIFAVVLVLLLIFVLQNTRKVEISYLGFDFTMPLAVAILLAAAIGVLLAAIAGTYRILQLRRRVKKGLPV